jgi:hypothetical protein
VADDADTPTTDEAASPAGGVLSHRRRYAIRALYAVALVLAVLAIFSVWANRQLLNAQNWSNTSSELLQNPAIQTQVSAFLVDQVYANVDVAGQVRQALPPRAKPLAGEAANGLRGLAEQTTNKLLGRPRIQEAWKAANKLTAQQFINIAQGKSGAITSSGNAVVLDLGVLVRRLVQRLGLPPKLSKQIPPSAGKVKILQGNQVTALQDGASALRGLAIILPILSLGLFALAVYLARGRRRPTLLWVGIDLVVAGALVLIGRNLVGGYVVDALAKTEAVKPAADATWSIATSMLKDVAQACIIGAIPVIVAAWLAGPARPAMAFRRAAAPWLRDRTDITYGVVAALVLLVVAWGPIPATRKVIPVLIMIGLVILGVQALRRQVAEEFPDAQAGATSRALRERASSALGRRRAKAGDGRSAEPVPEGDGKLERLERLAKLHESGALTDGEYAAEKATVLSS